MILKERKFRGRAAVLELKIAGTFGEMEDKCREALAQIEEKKYEEGLRNEGCREVFKYGVCFYKKGCIVMSGPEKDEA